MSDEERDSRDDGANFKHKGIFVDEESLARVSTADEIKQRKKVTIQRRNPVPSKADMIPKDDAKAKLAAEAGAGEGNGAKPAGNLPEKPVAIAAPSWSFMATPAATTPAAAPAPTWSFLGVTAPAAPATNTNTTTTTTSSTTGSAESKPAALTFNFLASAGAAGAAAPLFSFTAAAAAAAASAGGASGLGSGAAPSGLFAPNVITNPDDEEEGDNEPYDKEEAFAAEDGGAEKKPAKPSGGSASSSKPDGEQDDHHVMAIKAKLFILEDEKWVERGVGELRVNRTPSLKTRLVMRVIGSLRLILNAIVHPHVPIALAGDKTVRVTALVVGQSEKDVKVSKFLIRVATKAEAESLLETLKAEIQRAKDEKKDSKEGDKDGEDKAGEKQQQKAADAADDDDLGDPPA